MSKIPVTRMSQRGYTLYAGHMTAQEMLDLGIVDEWDSGKGWDLEDQGYQRAPIDIHSRRIGEFLQREQDPLLPTSALISAREGDYGKLKFEAVPGSDDFGYLHLSEERRLFIVDYQHRWRGFRYAIEKLNVEILNTVQIPVVIMADVPRFEEMRQFHLINSKQRRIDTDLALTLMQAMAEHSDIEELYNLVGPGNRYRIRATKLTVKIAEMVNTPWTGRIAEPNIKDSTQVASIKSFVDSLRPIISTRPPFHTFNDGKLVSLILDYWRGIQEVMPEAFEEPTQHSIQKSPGLFVMHRVAANYVFNQCLRSDDFTPSHVKSIISKSKTYIVPRFWRTGGSVSTYSSGAGHRELANLIISELT